MRVKFGSIIVDGAGKIGGHVVGHSATGAFLATKRIAKSTSTPSQQRANSITGYLQRKWRELSNVNRISWNLNPYSGMSGINSFLFANYWNAYFNTDLINTKPQNPVANFIVQSFVN